jgi:hypothetical protein
MELDYGQPIIIIALFVARQALESRRTILKKETTWYQVYVSNVEYRIVTILQLNARILIKDILAFYCTWFGNKKKQ